MRRPSADGWSGYGLSHNVSHIKANDQRFKSKKFQHELSTRNGSWKVLIRDALARLASGSEADAANSNGLSPEARQVDE